MQQDEVILHNNKNCKQIDRIFHRQISIGEICGIAFLTIAMVYSFWNKIPLIALILAICLVKIIEQVINTTYKFTIKNNISILEIYKGRLSKTKIIHIKDITDCKRINSSLGLSHFLVLIQKL